MVVYTQFSRGATPAERKKLWDPSKTLGIINTDPGYQCITCIGYAPTQRRRCRNRIRADNRAFITETLDDIAYLPPDSPAVTSRLRAIAGPALCVAYHQGQAEKIVSQWQRTIQQLKLEIEEPRPTKPVPSSMKQESVQDQSTGDFQEQMRELRELVDKLREELKSQRGQDQGRERREEQAEKDRREEERRRRHNETVDREARRQENERLEKERLEKERLEKERLEKERLEKERKEREEKQQREREQAASNERIRQRAKKVREQREREKREREQKEREEWDQAWTRYQERWVIFRASGSRDGNIRDAIPWPVKSGSSADVGASNVKEFLQKAAPRDADVAKLLRNECRKWHPDMIHRWLRGSELHVVDQMRVDMICRVVTDLLDKSAGRSAEFLG